MLSRLLLPAFTFLFTLFASAQNSHLTFIKEPPDKSRLNTKDSTLAYPVFKFRNTQLSKSINNTLKADFANFYELENTSPIRTLLKNAAESGLVELSYNELRNDHKILSFYLGSEAIAAYSTYWETTYAFSTTTGHRLTLDSLVIASKRDRFMTLLRQMQKNSIKKYKEQMLLSLQDSTIEKEDYEYIEEQTRNDCWEHFSPRDFKLYKDYIEVIIDCEFPHVIQALSPPSVLTLPIKQYKEYFRPELIE